MNNSNQSSPSKKSNLHHYLGFFATGIVIYILFFSRAYISLLESIGSGLLYLVVGGSLTYARDAKVGWAVILFLVIATLASRYL